MSFAAGQPASLYPDYRLGDRRMCCTYFQCTLPLFRSPDTRKLHLSSLYAVWHSAAVFQRRRRIAVSYGIRTSINSITALLYQVLIVVFCTCSRDDTAQGRRVFPDAIYTLDGHLKRTPRFARQSFVSWDHETRGFTFHWTPMTRLLAWTVSLGCMDRACSIETMYPPQWW